MALNSLPNAVVVLLLVGIISSLGVLVTDKFTGVSGVTATANTSIIAARDALGNVAEDWMDLIVTVVVIAIILALVIGGFASYGRMGVR